MNMLIVDVGLASHVSYVTAVRWSVNEHVDVGLASHVSYVTAVRWSVNQHVDVGLASVPCVLCYSSAVECE